MEEAKADFDAKLAKRLATTGDNIENVDDEEEVKEEEEEDDTKKKKKKSSQSKSNQSEAMKKLLVTHPLKVQLKVNLPKNAENNVIMTFSHITELEVVSVDVKVNLDQTCKSQSGEREVLQPQHLLAHLLTSKDDGISCPNPAFKYILKNNGLDNHQGLMSSVGFMYDWVQKLSGLGFPDSIDPNFCEPFEVNAEASTSQSFVEKIIDAIRERLLSRIALQRQIFQLDKSKLISVELDVPESCRSLFPTKVSSVIRAWAPVNWEQYMALDVTKHLVETKIVDENDYLFRLQLNR